MQAIAELIRAVASLLWPVLLAVCLYLIATRTSRAFWYRGMTIEYAGTKVSVEAVSEQLLRSVEDVQNKIAEQKEQIDELRQATAGGKQIEPQNGCDRPSRLQTSGVISARSRHVLWIGGAPEQYILEEKRIRDLGLEVHWARTAAEAERVLKTGQLFSVVVIESILASGASGAESRISAMVEMLKASRVGRIIIYSSGRSSGAFVRNLSLPATVIFTDSPIDLLRIVAEATTDDVMDA